MLHYIITLKAVMLNYIPSYLTTCEIMPVESAVFTGQVVLGHKKAGIYSVVN